MLGKLEQKKFNAKQLFKKLLKENRIELKTITTRALIEVALEQAQLYKYQKVLMLTEILERCNEGEYQW